MSGFFEEVKRRKVYRVAVAYIIAAGGIIQLASAAFPAWELPNWALRLVIVLLLIGFPIALIFAWIFDITSTGIQRTSATEAQPLPKPQRRRNMLILASTGAAIAIAAGFFLLPRAVAHKLDKSIAVLPFENFSDDKDSGYFADGIQDDILTNLAKIRDLKVISRTSVMAYRGQLQKNAREIGKALGVSAILEGSVRKDKNRVRVNVQLINANNDEHLWAEDYDRDLNDVFAIQTDLAKKIANELQAKLSPTEKIELTRKPTENGEAYLAFIQARNLFVPEDLVKLKQAEQLYDRALELDPKFALALAEYSRMESWIYRNFDPTPSRMQKGRALVQRALDLQPDLPEGHLALGFWYYYGDNNFESALQEFEIAQRGLPNDAGAYLAIGAIQRRQGRWQESNANLEKAAELSPKDSWPLQNLAFNYEMLRDYDRFNKTVDRALEISPGSFSLWEMKTRCAIEQRGDFSVWENAQPKLKAQSSGLSPDLQQQLTIAEANIAILQRKFEDAIRIAESVPDDVVVMHPDIGSGKYAVIGIGKWGLHDHAGAREAFTKAKEMLQTEIAKAPSDTSRQAALALVLAALGERDAALATAQRVTQLVPESKDAFDGPRYTENLAETHAILGEVDQAVNILDGLLSRPSTVTVAMLKINPVWDRIRDQPSFQALLQKHSAKT